MPLPDHYKRFFRLQLRLALVMMALGLLSGILFQESGKKVPISAAVPVGAHLEYVLGLALVHGHTFVLGVLLPLALTVMLQLGLTLGHRPVPARSLAMASGLLVPSSAAVIILMLAKGYHFVLGVRHGRGFADLSATFLGGHPASRAAIYGLSHGGLALGLAIFGWALWRSLEPSAD